MPDASIEAQILYEAGFSRNVAERRASRSFNGPNKATPGLLAGRRPDERAGIDAMEHSQDICEELTDGPQFFSMSVWYLDTELCLDRYEEFDDVESHYYRECCRITPGVQLRPSLLSSLNQTALSGRLLQRFVS